MSSITGIGVEEKSLMTESMNLFGKPTSMYFFFILLVSSSKFDEILTENIRVKQFASSRVQRRNYRRHNLFRGIGMCMRTTSSSVHAVVYVQKRCICSQVKMSHELAHRSDGDPNLRVR